MNYAPDFYAYDNRRTTGKMIRKRFGCFFKDDVTSLMLFYGGMI